MNDTPAGQLQIDFLTGAPTGFTGGKLTREQWRATRDLNYKRSSSVKKIHGYTEHWGPIPSSVWSRRVFENAQREKIPIVSIEGLGIHADEDGVLYSRSLTKVGSGKEATAWLDEASQCVYKLFDATEKGNLGEKIDLVMEGDFDCVVEYRAALLPDILDKLRLMHAIGCCPTEIVGLGERGDYLVAKQPLCFDYEDLERDTKKAVANARAVRPNGSYRSPLWLFWAEDQLWAMGDLHKGNIMRSRSGEPLIIDTHIGLVGSVVVKNVSAIARARLFALKAVGKEVSTQELTLESDEDL